MEKLSLIQPSEGTITLPAKQTECVNICNIFIIANGRQYQADEVSKSLHGLGHATYFREYYPGVKQTFAFSLN